jgi:hypothetical protein
MAYPTIIAVTFSDVGTGLDGQWVLTFDEGLGYWVFSETHAITGGTASTQILVQIVDLDTFCYGDYSETGEFIPDYEVSFQGTTIGQYATDFTNEVGPGTAHVSSGPPKAVNPAPATASTDIKTSLDVLSWEIPG